MNTKQITEQSRILYDSITQLRHIQDMDRLTNSIVWSNDFLIQRVKATLAHEIGMRTVRDIIESKKEGLRMTEEKFYSTKLFNKKSHE